MAASAATARQPRRGPAPIASFDHDVSDEVRPPSSPETKQAFRLPEIREDPAAASQTSKNAAESGGPNLLPPEQRARSHSTPNTCLNTPAAPRIDISRASSSSHQDSRDSSPELALFTGGGSGEEARSRLELGFREDGALDLRSSTEELAFLEGAPGEPKPPPAPPPPAPASRRHSRKDSQSSEAALLAVSGRTSRLSSVGSQCSAHSALSAFSHVSHISRLSVVSGVSRSPSPHRMLLETSFCGPKPIETDPEICAAAVEEHLLEISKINSPPPPTPGDARDRREVRTEATVESAPSTASPVVSLPPSTSSVPLSQSNTSESPVITIQDDKQLKETKNKARAEERRVKPRLKREPSEPEVYKSVNRSKDIIRIKLKPDEDYEEDDGEEPTPPKPATEVEHSPARKPASLALAAAARPSYGSSPPRAPPSRSPSPAGPPVSRKSSFCSLFKSRETIASPESPSEALRRKRSLTEGRSRSKSRDRSATPTSVKLRGSVLSLFRTPKRGAPASPSPSSREGSPVVHVQRPLTTSIPVERTRRGEKLKYYEDTRDGIIHIPLRTPPDEQITSNEPRRDSETRVTVTEVITHHETPRPASAPTTRLHTDSTPMKTEILTSKSSNCTRTVLPDGSIIIPLRSPTEKKSEPSYEPSNGIGYDDSKSETTNAIEHASMPNIGGPPEGRDAADGAEASPIRESHIDTYEVKKTNLPCRSSVDTLIDGESGRRRRKERLVFTTHVGSREQVFSTQFSITKTPSVTSEISGSFPSFTEGDESRSLRPRESSVGSVATPELEAAPGAVVGAGAGAFEAQSPQEGARDSSGSEGSSEAAAAATALVGSEAERRVLVVQDSFEEELPFVPTTLPLERSLALPMVPVRERRHAAAAPTPALERPRAAPALRAAAPRHPAPAAAPATPPRAPPDKLRIRLPRRAPPASASASGAASSTSRASRSRTRSGGDGAEEARPRAQWIDFEEVPERRKQPKRIQTLPDEVESAPAPAPAPEVLFSYVDPERCRCECHHAQPRAEDAASSPETDGASFAKLSLTSPEQREAGAGEEPSPRTSRSFPRDSALPTTRALRESPPPAAARRP